MELSKLRKFISPEVVTGENSRFLLAKYIRNLGMKNPMIVTDSGIIEAGWVQEILNLLNSQGVVYELFCEILPNPRDFQVEAGAKRFASARCDSLIAIGGGSVIDCAKGIGIVFSNKQPIHTFEGVDKVKAPMPPLVCIPTTSGSSADVSQFAIINHVEAKTKFAIISSSLIPDVSLIDPVVLQTMSSFLTACTAIDAMTHAFEAYVSLSSSEITDLHALESIRLIHENLPLLIENQSSIHHWNNLMIGSYFAGIAFSNASLGCTHSLAHSLGGYLDLPHGECNALLLPYVVDFNFFYAASKYRKIATILGLHCNISDNRLKDELVNYLIQFSRNLGITDTLKLKGITANVIPILASKSILDPCNATNPRIPSQTDLETIYKEAL